MANLYKMFGTNEAAEKQGKWIEFGEGAAFKLRRAGGKNRNFAKVLERKARPHRRALQTNTVDDGVAERLMVETYAQSIVMDWRNITDETGAELKFSVEACIKLFTDLPDVFEAIREEAEKLQNFQDAELEEDEKN